MKIRALELEKHHFVTKRTTIQIETEEEDTYWLYGGESNCLFFKVGNQPPGVTPLTFYSGEAKRIAEALGDIEGIPTPHQCYNAVQINL